MYPSMSMLVVLAEVALLRAAGSVLLVAGVLGMVAAGRKLMAASPAASAPGGALVVARGDSRSTTHLGLMALGFVCVVAGLMLWTR